MNKLYCADDFLRQFQIVSPSKVFKEEYRSDLRRDYARLIHSPSFRRLQGKKQLFPGIESDFFRNRLTHSLEVAQIAKSIAIKINAEHPYFKENNIDVDLVETAGLAHDLGHPPFGHNGELALDDRMKEYGGFEGNAQTFRILSRIEKRELAVVSANGLGINDSGYDTRIGLNLTYRTLASVIKYDTPIPTCRREELSLVKGYYSSDEELISKIRAAVVQGKNYEGKFKTIECQIMDVADDIAYSTYDLEDSLKAGFVNILQILSSNENLLSRIADQVTNKDNGLELNSRDVLDILYDLFSLQDILGELDPILCENIDLMTEKLTEVYKISAEIGSNGHLRSNFTSHLVGTFIRGIEVELNESVPALSKVKLNIDVLKKVEVLKRFNYETLIMSPMLKVAEFRGYDIVSTIFQKIDYDNNSRKGYHLMPDDLGRIYGDLKNTEDKKRTICDFIAGMTDRYAVEFYSRLVSENDKTIFKPL